MKTNRKFLNQVQFLLLALLVVFSPIIRGGNRPLAILILELLTVFLIVLLIVKPDFISSLSRTKCVFLFLLIFYPFLYFVPLPLNFWQSLPGRGVYSEIYQLIGATDWKAITLVPIETIKYVGVSLLAISVFLTAIALPERELRKLVTIVLSMACFESILGLLQFGGGVESGLRFGNTDHGTSAIGTFANRNHLAGYLEMVLPVAMALTIARYGKAMRFQPYFSSTRQRLAYWMNNYADSMFMFGAISGVLLIGIVFSRSRTGLFLSMIGLLLFAIIFARRLGKKKSVGVTASFLFVALSVTLLIGLAPVLQRFTDSNLLEDTRWTIFSSSVDGIKTFYPVGSGPGTFSGIFPQFQPSGMTVFINYAHNDYLELFFESGLIGIMLTVFFLFLYFSRWADIISEKRWDTFHYIQAGAGIGILLMLFHSLTDFNLHIPANLILFAFFLAVFVKSNTSMRDNAKSKKTQDSGLSN